MLGNDSSAQISNWASIFHRSCSRVRPSAPSSDVRSVSGFNLHRRMHRPRRKA